MLFDLGLRRTSAISGGLLLSTETLLAVALAVVVLREHLSRPAAFALLAGTIGGVLVSLGAGNGRQMLPGDLLVLAGSATAASYYVVGRKLPTGDDTLTGTAYQLLAALGVAVAYGALSWPTQGSSISTASPSHLAVALATGIVGIAIPFFLINRSLGTVLASTAALVLNLTPLFAVGSAIALLHEPLMAVTASGGALILAGVIALGRFSPEPLEAMTS
jgi:drug/metabolite transporter (DMT)-like permease